MPINKVRLAGSATDTDCPDGKCLTYQWSVGLMPVGATAPVFANATRPDTWVSFAATSVAQEFRLRLTVKDERGGLDFKDVVVRVNPSVATAPNIAQGKRAFTKTNGTSTYQTTGNATDGNAATYWASADQATTDKNWLAVDLGSNFTVNRFVIKHYQFAVDPTSNWFNLRDFRIEWSPDGDNNWQTIPGTTVTGNTAALSTIQGFTPVTCQYVRVYVIQGNGNAPSNVESTRAHIPEFEVYAQSPNTAPIADAGADVRLQLPTNSLTLTGTGTDPDGSIASYGWTQTSGATTVTLTNANTATLTASNLAAGSYTFRLTATDNQGATGSDEVVVNVVSNQLPTVNAGSNRETYFNSILLAGQCHR